MSSHNEQLEPTPFEAVQPDPLPTTAGTGQRRERGQESHRDGLAPWVLPTLGGLVLLAGLVIFWLPDRVAPDADTPGAATDPQSATVEAPDNAGTATGGVSKPDVSPWSDAQMAKLRKEAQDVLAQLLDLQFALEEQGVKVWAPDRFAAVAGVAAAGDELYRSREYLAAKARYEEALAALQALQNDIPVALAQQLELALMALDKGDPQGAMTALDMVAAIDPANAELEGLRQRLAALPQLLALLEQAAAAEQLGDLPAAIALLEQASALDPAHPGSQAELARLQTALTEQQFSEAMSQGYTALDANRFDEARKAFGRAARLQAGSTEAASALQEVEAAATAYRLASLKQKGLAYEQAEQWQQAVDTYEQARKIDPNVLYARDGLARSEGRARLDKQFRAAIDEPGRLADVTVATATERLLQQARKISPRGPVLAQQLTRLEVLLKEANTPVRVALRSDQQTEVTVYKVARLGRFDQRDLELRPGSYTAVGSRLGYRDVRVEFTVRPGNSPPAVTIICTESIQ